MLSLSNSVYNMLNHEVILISLLLKSVHSLNQIQLPLFILSKVNIAISRPFPCFRCLTMLIIRLNHEVIFISLLFRFVHSLNHIQLPLFVLFNPLIPIDTYTCNKNVILFLRHF